LVYAHYGRVEDFVTLESRGINVSGRIVMARYGKIFRGSIVRLLIISL
jgi:N-acetylated-alpha-linked acidic dipeptidase